MKMKEQKTYEPIVMRIIQMDCQSVLLTSVLENDADWLWEEKNYD